MKKLSKQETLLEYMQDEAGLYCDYFITDFDIKSEDDFYIIITIDKEKLFKDMTKNLDYLNFQMDKCNLTINLEDFENFIEDLMNAYDSRYGETKYMYDVLNESSQINWNQKFKIRIFL